MAYNHKMTKEAKHKYNDPGVPNSYSKSETFNVHDTDRYLTDDYAINIAIQENVDKYSIGVYITNYKVGVSGYQEYWKFGKDQRKKAIETYKELRIRIAAIIEEFEYQNWPLALLKPMIRNILGDLEVGAKEKSGVYHFNWYTLDPHKEPDWRVSLYGNRYPGHEMHRMDEDWTVNSEEVSKQIEVDGRETRDRIQRYRYAGETKLAQFNRMMEMIQKFWPYLSAAAIMSFLMIYTMKGGDLTSLTNQLQENPQEVRSQIPEVEPDFTFDPAVEPYGQSGEVAEPTPSEPQNQFATSLQSTLEYEGGYVNHPSDPGGETNKGITRRVYEQWLRNKGLPSRSVNMREIPDEHVEQLYKEMYWDKVGGDHLPADVAQQLFDYAVQSGKGRAVKTLQKIVGSKPDGGFGPNTLRSTQAYVDQYGSQSLAREILNQRRAFLNYLLNESKNKEQYAPFRNGWMNRMDSLENMLGSAKPMRMRSKTVPENQVLPFQSQQADFWGEKDYPSV